MSENGLSVRLIGAMQGNFEQVHASHYDAARITRRIGPDVIWSELAKASIARYSDIEMRSGLPFHTGCGHCDVTFRPATRIVYLSCCRTAGWQ